MLTVEDTTPLVGCLDNDKSRGSAKSRTLPGLSEHNRTSCSGKKGEANLYNLGELDLIIL